MVDPFQKLRLSELELEVSEKNCLKGRAVKLYRYDYESNTFTPGIPYRLPSSRLLYLNDIENVRNYKTHIAYETELLRRYETVQKLIFHPVVALIIFTSHNGVYSRVGILYRDIFYEYIDSRIMEKHISQCAYDFKNSNCVFINTLINEKHLLYGAETRLTQAEFILRVVGISKRDGLKVIHEMSLNDLCLYLTKRCESLCFRPIKIVQ